jgi:hypothetical protein
MLKLTGWAQIIVVILLLFGVIGALWYGFAYDQQSDDPERGPAASWSEQLAIAAESAEKEGGDYVLTDVSAQPISIPYKLENDLAFVGEFLFVRNADDDLSDGLFVTLNDVMPRATVREDRDSLVFFPLGQRSQNLEDYRQALDNVKLSPRDVYERTLPDARAVLGENYGYTVRAYLHLLGYRGVSDSKAVWSIYYYGAELQVRINYWLDPGTGEILKRELEDYRAGATPTPTVP